MSQVLFDSTRQIPAAAFQMQAFLDTVKNNAALKEKLRLANGANGIVAVAKEAGFDVSAADISGLTRSKIVSVSDQELDEMAGMYAKGCYWTCASNSTKLT